MFFHFVYWLFRVIHKLWDFWLHVYYSHKNVMKGTVIKTCIAFAFSFFYLKKMMLKAQKSIKNDVWNALISYKLSFA